MIKNKSSMNKKAAVLIAAAAVVLLFAGIFCGAAAAADTVTITFYDADGQTVVGTQTVSGIPQDDNAKVVLLDKTPFKDEEGKYFIGWKDCSIKEGDKGYYTDRQALNLTKDSSDLRLKAVFTDKVTKIDEDYSRTDYYIKENGYYKIDPKDTAYVSSTMNVSPGVLAVLDLNGNEICRDASDVCIVKNYGTLMITSGYGQGRISDGEADKDYVNGAGIRVFDGASLTIEKVIVQHNITNYPHSKGGGIYIAPGGQVTMLDGTSIGRYNVKQGDIGNDANDGAGVYVDTGAMFTMAGGEITENQKFSVFDECGYGNGVYVAGTFNMLNGRIYKNAARESNEYWYGAGVYVGDGGKFVMTGGQIDSNGHKLDNNKRKGSGVYIASGGTFIARGGEVRNNSGEKTEGTGIYCEDGGDLYVSGTFNVQNNQKEDIRFCGTNSLFLTAPYTGTLKISAAPEVVGRSPSTYIPTFDDLSHIICSGGVVGINAQYNLFGNVEYCELKKSIVAHPVSFEWPISAQNPPTQAVIDNGLAAKPADPAGDEAYRFGGWYADSACTIPFDFTTDRITAKTTIYGKEIPCLGLINYKGKIYTENAILDEGSPFAGCEYSFDTRTLTLTKNISVDDLIRITAPGTLSPVFTIDLNGYALSSTAQNRPVIMVAKNSGLNIIDSNPGVKQYFDKLPSGKLQWKGPGATGGDVCLNGGIITGGTQSGVDVRRDAKVVMSGGSIVGNTAGTDNGGGVYIAGGGSFVLKGGAVTGNIAEKTDPCGGGIYVEFGGLLIVESGEIFNNIATNSAGYRGLGGGVYSDGNVSITGGSIFGNSATDGGGIYLGSGGRLTLRASAGVIGSNLAKQNGGGVYVGMNTTFTMEKGTVSANTAKCGGGVYDDGKFVMNGGEISSNIAQNTIGAGGAGVYVNDNASFTLTNGSITANISNTYGGGVQCNGTFEMDGGAISENVAKIGGGGVYVEKSAVPNAGFIFTNGSIFRNTVTGDEKSSGGGICVNASGKAVMRLLADSSKPNNPEVGEGNKANYGGGVFVGENSSFTMECGSIGTNMFYNQAEFGGGFYVQNEGTFTMSGGEIKNNLARSEGGGGIVYNGGKFIATGGVVMDNFKGTAQYRSFSGIGVTSDNPLKSVRVEMSDKASVSQISLGDGAQISIPAKFADGTDYGAFNITLKEGSLTGTVVAECADETIAQDSLSHLSLDPTVPQTFKLAADGKNIILQQTKCTVTFINEGSTYMEEIVAYNTPVNQPSPPTPSKGEFLGWYTSAGTPWDFNTPVTSDLTLYAKWKEDVFVDIVFNPEGGEFVKDHSIDSKKVSCLVGSTFEPYFKDLGVSRPSYTFAGWFDAEEGGTQILKTDKVTAAQPLYAQWTPINYKIEYNPGDGSGEKDYQDCVYGVEAALKENHFTPKSGYTFAGWAVPGFMELKQPGEMVLNLATEEGAKVPVTAAWKANMHTVIFISDGAEYFSMPAETGSFITKPADPQKTHYTFAGWYKENTFVNPWDFGTDRMPDNDLSLYAKWTEDDKYKVTYDVNGGTGTAPQDSVEYYAGTKVTVKNKTESMKMDGHYFAGWNTERDGTGTSYQPGDLFTITDNTLLYAEWVKEGEYDVTVLTDGHGTASADHTSAAAGTPISLSSTEDAGYKFDHWEVIEGGVEIVNNTFTMPPRNVTIKAHFVPTAPTPHKITLEVVGPGEVHADKPSAVAGEEVTLTCSAEKGYAMTDWRIYPEDLEIKVETETTMTFVMPDDNVYLYGFFGPVEEKYIVIYDRNGATSGDVPIDSNEYDAGATVTVLGNTGRLAIDGYTFSGWSTDRAGAGTSYQPDSTFEIFENVSLYAKWTPVPGPKPVHHSGSQGSSIWLTETPTPTPTPTPTQTGVPTSVPLTPTETSKSPVGVAGILAGLGAAAVLLRRK